MGRRPPAARPATLASDIAAGLSRLRSVLAETYAEPLPDRKPMKREKGKPWPVLPVDRALDAGLPFHELVRQGVREALFRTLADQIYHPIRAALGPALPVCWYGHQDAAWIAHLEVLRRLGLISVGDGSAFVAWTTLARSGGWWWPGEQHCVVVDRPAVIRMSPMPGAWHGELRRDTGQPAVDYRDGWSI
ncbi:DUF6745 domain-containing protein [Paractinoplanes durhamensis]|uniref:DUF6745 domain-containing protein n=1 Tax=Paractinoplanes durhamensis TaxID=113563 RepID=UPI003633E6BB